MKVSTNLYYPPSKGRCIYVARSKNCGRYVAVAHTPHYKKSKLFDTIGEGKQWIDWFLDTPGTKPESVEEHNVRYCEFQMNTLSQDM